MMLTFSNSGWTHFSEPQLMIHIPPVIHLPQRHCWFPWAWLKRQDLEQTHSSNTESLVCAFSPIEESAAHFWHHCLGEMNPGKAEVGSVGRTGLPQPVGAAHLIQFTQCIGSSIWQTAASAHGSLWANICYPFASISHFPHIQPKHTTKNCYTTAAFIPKQPT